MEKPSKESLLKLLDLISKISELEGNQWFRKELSNRFYEKSFSDSFPEYFKKQKQQYKIKGRNFYSDIKDKNLRNELVIDFVEMSWYQSINNINRFMLFAFYQMENLINYYCLISNSFEKIIVNKDFYSHSYNEKFTVIPYDSFYFKETKKPLEKINIWAKLTYWAIDSNSIDWESNNHYNISNLIKFRNENSHRNSELVNEELVQLINTIKKADITVLSFYINILKYISKSLDKVNPEVKKLEIKVERKKIEGPKVIGKIDLPNYKK